MIARNNCIQKGLRRLFIGVFLALFFFSCSKDQIHLEDHFFLSQENQQKRVQYSHERLPFEPLGRLKGDPGDYTFTVVASVDPPTVTGLEVQACDVHFDGSKLYVAYNYAGETYRGALDVYSYTLDPVNTTLTAEYSLGFPTSDINAVVTIPGSSDSYEVFAVGSTQGYSGYGLTSPAFMIYLDPTLTSYHVENISGFVANSISYESGASWFSVCSGTNGGLSLFDRNPVSQIKYMDKVNMTSVFNLGNNIFQVQSIPLNLVLYNRISATSLSYPLPGHTSDASQKSAIKVKYGHSFLALNDGGTIIFNNSSGTITEAITPSSLEEVPNKYKVSNGLCVGDYRLFSANGGAGLSIFDLDYDMEATAIGSVFTGQSVNEVKIIQEGSDSGYIAVVSGKAGIKIIYYTISPSLPTYIDPRDGNEYKYVTIGFQTWMAENLAYLPKVNPSTSMSQIIPKYYVYAFEGNQVSAAKATSNYSTYGVLYNYHAANTACPSGWHLATDAEWQTLEQYYAMNFSQLTQVSWRNTGQVGYKLKSLLGWEDSGNGINKDGFNVLPAGVAAGEFNYLLSHSYFWVEGNPRSLVYNQVGIWRSFLNGFTPHYGFSVRCIKD
jgi:uncharacterized protein (TIGR02145 family)